MSFWDFQPYVPVAARRAWAARGVEKLKKKKGGVAAPVLIQGRKIAQSFWGKAWCDNLERYSDFASRLPRGRSYVRNGSVIDLQIERRGLVRALRSAVRASMRWRSASVCRHRRAGRRFAKIAPAPSTRWSIS